MGNQTSKKNSIPIFLISLTILISLACGSSTSEKLASAVPNTPETVDQAGSSVPTEITQEDKPPTQDEADATLPTSTAKPEPEEIPPTPTPEPEPINLISSGFGQDDSVLGFAFIVKNPNDSIAFESSQYQIAVFSEDGTVVETDSGYIELLLPGQILGVGGDIYLSEGITASSVEVQLNAGNPEATDLDTAFTVDRIKYQKGDYYSYVRGVIINPFDKDITDLRVSSIVYNEAGEIIGGGYTYLNFLLANNSSGVSISTVSVGNVATVEIYATLSGFSDIDKVDDIPPGSLDIELVKSGFGQDGSVIGYGLIINNPNNNYSVNSSSFQVSLYAEDGTVIETDEGYIDIILPDQTVGIGGEIYVSDEDFVSRADIQIKNGYYEESAPIPPFTSENISYIDDEYYPVVTGQIASPYSSDITDVRVSAICYDETGEINGGGYSYIDFIPGNSMAAAEVSVSCSKPPATVELYANLSSLSEIE